MSLLEQLINDRASASDELGALEQKARYYKDRCAEESVRINDLDKAIAALNSPMGEDLGLPAHDPNISGGHASIEQSSGPDIPEGFIAWGGGEWEGDPETIVRVFYRAGFVNGMSRAAHTYGKEWAFEGDNGIIAYRIIEPARAETEDEFIERATQMTDAEFDRMKAVPTPEAGGGELGPGQAMLVNAIEADEAPGDSVQERMGYHARMLGQTRDDCPFDEEGIGRGLWNLGFTKAEIVATPDHLRRDPIAVRHASDCGVHNEPAFPNGPCNCELGGGIASVSAHTPPGGAKESRDIFQSREGDEGNPADEIVRALERKEPQGIFQIQAEMAMTQTSAELDLSDHDSIRLDQKEPA
jgi:hypothetical protein